MIQSPEHDLAKWRSVSAHQQKKINPVQSKNRARPMAEQLITTCIFILLIICLIGSHQWWPKKKIFLLSPLLFPFLFTLGRHSSLMISELDSGSSVLGSSPGRGHCVVFSGKALNSHSAFFHPGV